MTTDGRQREEGRGWKYDVVGPGYNYRLTDFQCALGSSQLKRLPDWIDHRRMLAAAYSDALESVPGVRMLSVREGVEHAWHLMVVHVDPRPEGLGRDELFSTLRARGIVANVHYTPLTMLDRFSSAKGSCPVAERVGEGILTLPLHQGMQREQVGIVVDAIGEAMFEKSDKRGRS